MHSREGGRKLLRIRNTHDKVDTTLWWALKPAITSCYDKYFLFAIWAHHKKHHQTTANYRTLYSTRKDSRSVTLSFGGKKDWRVFFSTIVPRSATSERCHSSREWASHNGQTWEVDDYRGGEGAGAARGRDTRAAVSRRRTMEGIEGNGGEMFFSRFY